MSAIIILVVLLLILYSVSSGKVKFLTKGCLVALSVFIVFLICFVLVLLYIAFS